MIYFDLYLYKVRYCFRLLDDFNLFVFVFIFVNEMKLSVNCVRCKRKVSERW